MKTGVGMRSVVYENRGRYEAVVYENRGRYGSSIVNRGRYPWGSSI